MIEPNKSANIPDNALPTAGSSVVAAPFGEHLEYVLLQPALISRPPSRAVAQPKKQSSMANSVEEIMPEADQFVKAVQVLAWGDYAFDTHGSGAKFVLDPKGQTPNLRGRIDCARVDRFFHTRGVVRAKFDTQGFFNTFPNACGILYLRC